jgi:hypothetical protein
MIVVGSHGRTGIHAGSCWSGTAEEVIRLTGGQCSSSREGVAFRAAIRLMAIALPAPRLERRHQVVGPAPRRRPRTDAWVHGIALRAAAALRGPAAHQRRHRPSPCWSRVGAPGRTSAACALHGDHGSSFGACARRDRAGQDGHEPPAVCVRAGQAQRRRVVVERGGGVASLVRAVGDDHQRRRDMRQLLSEVRASSLAKRRGASRLIPSASTSRRPRRRRR